MREKGPGLGIGTKEGRFRLFNILTRYKQPAVAHVCSRLGCEHTNEVAGQYLEPRLSSARVFTAACYLHTYLGMYVPHP